MGKWEIPMPREPHPKGIPYVKFAAKYPDGGRVEFIGALDKDLATDLFAKICGRPRQGRDIGIEAAFAAAPQKKEG